MSNLIKTDTAYKNWISDVLKRFRKSQLKAAIKVNEEMLRFYWTMGRDIAKMSSNAKYGSQFYYTISTDLKDIFPDIKSFSPTNLKYMRYFYEMYPTAEIHQQVSDESEIFENRQQLADESGLQLIFCIPWGHHMFLLDKCKGDREKALYYVKKTIQNNWSRAVSTERGFVNRNRQKNNGRTQIPGTDNQQWFYEMECLGCGHKYYANGSDIWQRKCPKCQGGRP